METVVGHLVAGGLVGKVANMMTVANPGRHHLGLMLLCSMLLVLFPLSVTAQPELHGVMFVNSETEDVLLVVVESWDTSNEVKFVMRTYENETLVEGYLGEGFEVLDSNPVSEEDATEWDIEGGMEFAIERDGDPGTLYILPVERDVVIVGHMGEAFSDRRLNRFVGDVVEDGLDVRTPRGFERIDNIEDFL